MNENIMGELKVVKEDNIRLNQIVESKNKEIEKLKRDYEKIISEGSSVQLWTLQYVYEENGEVKKFEQNGMFKEDAEELIKLKSNKWNHFSLTKEERPDKDKVIEGLIIRLDSEKEIKYMLEERINVLEKELFELKGGK